MKPSTGDPPNLQTLDPHQCLRINRRALAGSAVGLGLGISGRASDGFRRRANHEMTVTPSAFGVAPSKAVCRSVMTSANISGGMKTGWPRSALPALSNQRRLSLGVSFTGSWRRTLPSGFGCFAAAISTAWRTRNGDRYLWTMSWNPARSLATKSGSTFGFPRGRLFHDGDLVVSGR